MIKKNMTKMTAAKKKNVVKKMTISKEKNVDNL